jgi:hypothetical protein
MPKVIKRVSSKTADQTAYDNTTVSRKIGREEYKTVKAGVPLDPFPKRGIIPSVSRSDKPTTEKNSAGKTVGLSVGFTRNMGDFESLRLDAWMQDTVQTGETEQQAYDRVYRVLEKALDRAFREAQK